MDREAGNLIDVMWMAWAAERLREQWPRADATSLEETARELWNDENLRSDGPPQAVEKWLREEVVGVYDAMQSDPGRAISAEEVFAAVRARHADGVRRKPRAPQD